MKRIVLAGNALTADIVAAHLRRDARYQVLACVVDDGYEAQGGVDGLPTLKLSGLAASHPSGDVSIIMAMGYNDLNRSRESMFNRLKEMGYAVETYVHPDAMVYSDHPIGEGALIFPGAVIEPHAKVGANTMVWAGVVLAHHSRVGDHCWIAANAVISGQAAVERNTFIGVSATVVNKVTVGRHNIIGAGALITKDTKDSSVHLARSAEPLRYAAEDYVKYFGF
jgi:sugar O-acyltransferase (sialic acid O-acetyltransferase NeuD family)